MHTSKLIFIGILSSFQFAIAPFKGKKCINEYWMLHDEIKYKIMDTNLVVQLSLCDTFSRTKWKYL